MCKTIFRLLLIFALIFPGTSASAVLNGELTQVGKYVVPVHSAKSWCSGVAISTRVVITNGHCTRQNNQVFTDLSVGYPGSNQVVSGHYIKVVEVITEPGFTWDNPRTVPKDDIAFLILESELPSVSVIRVATETDIFEMRNKGEVLLLQGYGLTGEGSVENFRSGFPSNGYFSLDNSLLFDPTLQSISSKRSSACNGDSGAPVIWETGKDVVLLGVNVGGGGADSNCRKASRDGIFRTEVQIPSRHSGILDKSILKAKQYADLKAIQEAEAKAAAELKAKQEAEALAAAELKAKQEAEIKAAEELRAKQEAEAAAALKAKQEADARAVASKKTTITCLKGKISKKVTGLKPKCPRGFKVKK